MQDGIKSHNSGWQKHATVLLRSFNVSCYTGYKAVSNSDLTSDIVGHLLHFAYIHIFCAELCCPID